MILRYEIIYGIVDYILQHPEDTYDDYIDFAGSFGFSKATSKFWIDLFLDAICNYLAIETSVSAAKNWLSDQINSAATLNQLCDKLIAMVAAVWDEEEEIIVTRNTQLYRKIQKYNIDLSQPPTGTHSVHFANIGVNMVKGEREAIITVGRWSYLLSWDKLPDRFKQLYTAWLRMQNFVVPQDLQQYIVDTIDISNLYFDVNLDKATLFNEK